MAALRLEAEQLRCQALSDRRVLDKLKNIPQSGTAHQTSQTLHRRYLQAIERRCDLRETLLKTAEVHSGQLQKENHSLRETVDHLRYKLKCAHYELKKALGVKAATGEEKAKDEDDSTDEDQKAAADKPRKRGAPKGHRGRTRPIPDKIDFTELIPPPETCSCGSHDVDPIDFMRRVYTSSGLDVPDICSPPAA